MLQPSRDGRPLAKDINQMSSSMSNPNANIVYNCAQLPPSLHERLIKAYQIEKVEEVYNLIDSGVDPSTIGAIHFATARRSVLMLKNFLGAGTLIDARNASSQTAL